MRCESKRELVRTSVAWYSGAGRIELLRKQFDRHSSASWLSLDSAAASTSEIQVESRGPSMKEQPDYVLYGMRSRVGAMVPVNLVCCVREDILSIYLDHCAPDPSRWGSPFHV